MITIPGTIMLDKKQKKKKVRPGNLIRAKANAAIELKKICPRTTTVVTIMEFRKKRPKGALFQAYIKFSKVKCLGIREGGKASISRDGLNAVKKVHNKGKTAQKNPIRQKTYVMPIFIRCCFRSDKPIACSFLYDEKSVTILR
jgi:hypothetical protein